MSDSAPLDAAAGRLARRLLDAHAPDRAYGREALGALPPPVARVLAMGLDHTADALVREGVPGTPWLDDTHPAITAAADAWASAVPSAVRYPAEAWAEAVGAAAHVALRLLVAPAEGLAAVAFDGADGDLPMSEVLTRLRAASPYAYLPDVVASYAARKDLAQLDRAGLERLLGRIERRMADTLSVDDWLVLAEPLFETAGPDGTPTGTLPSALVRLFLDARGRMPAPSDLPDTPVSPTGLRTHLASAGVGARQSETVPAPTTAGAATAEAAVDPSSAASYAGEREDDGQEDVDASGAVDDVAAPPDEPDVDLPAPDEGAPTDEIAAEPGIESDEWDEAPGDDTDDPESETAGLDGDPDVPSRTDDLDAWLADPSAFAADAPPEPDEIEDLEPPVETEDIAADEPADAPQPMLYPPVTPLGHEAVVDEAVVDEADEVGDEPEATSASGEPDDAGAVDAPPVPPEPTDGASDEPLWRRLARQHDAARPAPAPTADGPPPLWQRFAPSATPPAPDAGRPADPESVEARVLGPGAVGRREGFVRDLFGGDHAAYDDTLALLDGATSWTEATQILARDVFRRDGVALYSDAAVAFTDIVQVQLERRSRGG